MQMLTEIRQTQTTALGIFGAIAGAKFKRSWVLDRERLGDENWVAFVKCLARNEIELARHSAADPRFVAAPVSLTARISAPGERINLIGAAAPLVGSALAAMDRHVTVVRPGTTPPSGRGETGSPPYDIVHCGWQEFPDACPAAESMAVLAPSASAVLIMDSELFFAATSRIKCDVLLSLDFSSEDGANYSPRSDDNHFVFSDVFTRNVFHGNNFFEVKDVLTTAAGVPRADGATGCNRILRVSIVDEDKHRPKHPLSRWRGSHGGRRAGRGQLYPLVPRVRSSDWGNEGVNDRKPLFVFFGAESEYVLHPVFAEMTKQGHRCVELHATPQHSIPAGWHP